MEYLRVALPTRSVEVEITFSTPQPSLLSSSFRTSWSIVTLTATSTFPAESGVPESRPVAGSIFSQAGPSSMANLGFSMSQKLAVSLPSTIRSCRSPRERLA